MKTLRFKTNINCNNCKAKVANILNNEKGISSWDVDIDNLEKTLVVEGDVDPQTVISGVARVGFRAELI